MTRKRISGGTRTVASGTTRRSSLNYLIAVLLLCGMAKAPAQMVVNWSFAPNMTVPDNGSQGFVNTLGGFASYSNVSVSLNLTSTGGNTMFLGDMYANLTLGSQLAGEMQRTGVLLNRPGRDNTNAFGSSASALNVTLDDSITQPSGNVWASNGVAGTYNSDGRGSIAPNGTAVAFSDGDRNATLAALNGAAFASNRFSLLVADYASGGVGTLANYGYGVTGAAAASGTLDAGGATGTFSIGDTGSGAVNAVGASIVTTQAGGGPLVVNVAGMMSFNGGVSGTSGITKSGMGSLTLNSAGTFTGATIVNGGTLNAAVNNALQSTTSITVNNTGTLLLSGSGDRVSDTATLRVNNGGTLSTLTSTAETFGALTLQRGSTVNLGGATTFTFASLNLDTTGGGSFYTVDSYTSADHLIFNSGYSSYTDPSTLSDFRFTGFMDGGQAILISGDMFELVPVPEPGTWAAGILAVAAICWTQRRRFGRTTKRA